ncbi:MAG: Smr/MutS family protein [Hyphomicrobiales bacterium]|nr:Smr/MutS family protein [Hyphomicrobiales bacterium]
MAKPPKTPSPDGSPETDEDLWQRVAETAEPLKRGRNRSLLHEQNTPRPEVPEPAKRQQANAAKPPPAKLAPVKKSGAPAPLGSFDRREMRGLGQGRIDIDARIDLHGMRQREAHGALKAFLVRAFARGQRHVLVITGKGTQRRADEASAPYNESGSERGVLRNAVPRWLNEPALREMVVSFTTASPRHGGEGALYVRLRKADKAKVY